jgi:hypothetical protein
VDAELTPLRLGDLLRRARLARGLAIEDVELETHIRVPFLVALEEDDLAALPPPVFTRGLVRVYAGFLGIDPVEALDLLAKEERRGDSIGVEPTVPPARAPRSVPTWPLRLAAGLLLVTSAAGLAYLLLPREPAILALAATAVQARPTPVETVAALRVTAVPEARLALPTATITPPSPSPTPPPIPTLGPEDRATATAAAALRGLTLEARTNGRVWAQAELDGQIAYAGILMPGERRTWRAERRLALYVGDAGLVEVTVNGRTLGTLGPSGEVVRQEWTASR